MYIFTRNRLSENRGNNRSMGFCQYFQHKCPFLDSWIVQIGHAGPLPFPTCHAVTKRAATVPGPVKRKLNGRSSGYRTKIVMPRLLAYCVMDCTKLYRLHRVAGFCGVQDDQSSRCMHAHSHIDCKVKGPRIRTTT